MLTRGQIVYSTAGKDKGSFMIVLSVDNGEIVVCDGKRRPLEKPKIKNSKHLASTSSVVDDEQLQTNRTIRHALVNFKANNVKGEI